MRIISRRILFFSLVAGAPITGVVAQQHINHELAPNIDVTSFQISPDDCRAVYQTNRRHSGPIGGEVYTVLIGGGTATRIGDDRNYKYTINPNGNTVLYSDSRRVYSTPILGGATTEIVCTPTFPGPSASRKPGLRKQFTSSNRSLHPQNQPLFSSISPFSPRPRLGGFARVIFDGIEPLPPPAPPPSPGLQPLGNPA